MAWFKQNHLTLHVVNFVFEILREMCTQTSLSTITVAFTVFHAVSKLKLKIILQRNIVVCFITQSLQ
jgi:hypothetical protein